jgi:hypothetical protein
MIHFSLGQKNACVLQESSRRISVIDILTNRSLAGCLRVALQRGSSGATPMSILILLVFLSGAVLGMKFRVFILAPAVGLSILAVCAVGYARGDAPPTLLVAATLALTAIQIGYLAGILTRHAMVSTRGGSPRKAPLQAHSIH